MKSQRISVTQAPPTLLVDQGGKIRTERVKVKNIHATQVVDLGDATVTTGAGYELKAGEEKEFELSQDDRLYAVAPATQTTVVEVISNYAE